MQNTQNTQNALNKKCSRCKKTQIITNFGFKKNGDECKTCFRCRMQPDIPNNGIEENNINDTIDTHETTQVNEKISPVIPLSYHEWCNDRGKRRFKLLEIEAILTEYG